MDIHLADGDSFHIRRRGGHGAVIFTTAYDRHGAGGLQGEQHRLPAQPPNAADVQRALGSSCGCPRASAAITFARAHAGAARREQTFRCMSATRSFRSNARISHSAASCNEKVTAYTFAGASYPLDKTLEALQAVLPEADFFRANRQFIVAPRRRRSPCGSAAVFR
ncbi:MAG: LytTR family transcriptional regulator DNA-binding domain-containing protein [Alistipes finegoldii]